MSAASELRVATDGAREPVAAAPAPRRDGSFVRRPRLIERLASSVSAPLVVLTAPAGYSKTTCLAEWSDEDPRPFAWVSANRRHSDPALLVATMVNALDQIEPVDPSVVDSLASPSPAIATVVLPRLGESLARRKPFVLVVDDLHSLDSDVASEVLESVIAHLPPGAQLAIASRSEPPLHLGRLRAHRQVVELSQADLAMTKAESAELLRGVGVELNSARLALLFERTEGWPAVLYLAGLALADQRDTGAAVASYAGSDRALVDYLHDEFLSATRPAIQDFLIRSSILDELSGPLCDAVLEESGSGRVLRDLARSNALVVPLDRSYDRYRYHHLFAEMLMSELRRREPKLEPGLHARASRWYAEHSDADRAIDHAIAAEEFERAGRLIWEMFPEVSGRGRMATMERWLDSIGEDRVAESSHLALASAHRHLNLGRGPQAAHWGLIAAGIDDEEFDSSTEGDLLLLNAILATEGAAQMGNDAERASELLPDDSPWQSACHLFWGLSRHLTGERREATDLLRDAARHGAVVSSIVQVLSLSQLCLIAIEDDDWETASRLGAQAREQVRRCGLSDYPSVLYVYAVCAVVEAHEGRVEKAHEDVANAKRLMATLTDFPVWFEAQARVVLGRACVRLDDLTSARVLLRDSAQFLEQIPDAVVLKEMLKTSADALESAAAEGQGREWSLTKAELRTLQYLPSHLSFREIGALIHVSPNTVKTQAQAVYRKLDVSSRAEAVERARGAGLIDRDPLTGD